MTDLEARVNMLEQKLNDMMLSDKYLFQKPLIGGPNGLRLGSKTKDKVGFYDVAPTKQYSSTGVTLNMTTVGGATVTESNGFAGLIGSTFYTIGDIVAALKTIGILAR